LKISIVIPSDRAEDTRGVNKNSGPAWLEYAPQSFCAGNVPNVASVWGQVGRNKWMLLLQKNDKRMSSVPLCFLFHPLTFHQSTTQQQGHHPTSALRPQMDQLLEPWVNKFLFATHYSGFNSVIATNTNEYNTRLLPHACYSMTQTFLD
jgi:hypothetical protein